MHKVWGFLCFFDLKKMEVIQIWVRGRNNGSLISNVLILCGNKYSCVICAFKKNSLKEKESAMLRCSLLIKSSMRFLSRRDLSLQSENRRALRDLPEQVPHLQRREPRI